MTFQLKIAQTKTFKSNTLCEKYSYEMDIKSWTLYIFLDIIIMDVVISKLILSNNYCQLKVLQHQNPGIKINYLWLEFLKQIILNSYYFVSIATPQTCTHHNHHHQLNEMPCSAST